MEAQGSHSSMFCPGCMTETAHRSRCMNAECKWDESKQPEAQDHLPRHYLLFNRYYIGRVLGQGGFGVTYLARDMELERQMAIKEYLPREHCSRLTDRVTVRSYPGEKAELFSNGLQGFLNEAKNIARLDGHPNIVSITDHVKANGTAYMVMQFVHGKTLKQYLADQGGRIPYATARDIMLHVISGLRRAHQHGVLHRDISPDNIMVSSGGPVKIIDFGAARQASGGLARGLTVILKPGYAPEEQYRARGKQGPWTDVYAVAATLYRCITGEAPPDAPDRLDLDELVAPRAFCPDLPPKVEVAMLKGLAIKADDRYQNMDEFQEALLAAEPRPVNRGEEKRRQEPGERPKQKAEEKPDERPRVKEPERPKEMLAERPKEKKPPVALVSGPPSKPWFRSPLVLTLLGGLIALGVAVVVYLLGSGTGSSASAGTAGTGGGPVSRPEAVTEKRDWSKAPYNDPALGHCGGDQPCLDRKAKADALEAIQDWAAVPFNSTLFADCMEYQPCVGRDRYRMELLAVTNWERVAKKDRLLGDCMQYGPCVQRAAAAAAGSASTSQPPVSQGSLEEMGNYTYCKDSPNPRRCMQYKNGEGIKDGPTR